MEAGLGCDQAGAGARGGALVGKPKWARILAMTAGSSMVAMKVRIKGRFQSDPLIY